MGCTFHEELPDFDHKSINPYSALGDPQKDDTESAGHLTGSIHEIPYLSVESTLRYDQTDKMNEESIDNINHIVARDELNKDDIQRDDLLESRSISFGTRKTRLGLVAAASPLVNPKKSAAEKKMNDSRSAISAQDMIDDYRSKFFKLNFDKFNKKVTQKRKVQNEENIKELYRKLKESPNLVIKDLLANREDLMWLFSYNSRILDLAIQVLFCLIPRYH